MDPTPLQCPVEDCDVLAIHSAAANDVQQQPPVSGPEIVTRPKFTLDMTKEAWDSMVTSWEKYIQQCAVPDSGRLPRLKDVCDDGLLSEVYKNKDSAGLNTATLFLARMKELAVGTDNKSLHLCKFYEIVRLPGENMKTFSDRLIAAAKMCTMSVKCSSCHLDISVRDEAVRQMIVSGIVNIDIKKEVLCKTQEGRLPTLSSLVDYIASEEDSVSESNDLNSPGFSAFSGSTIELVLCPVDDSDLDTDSEISDEELLAETVGDQKIESEAL